MSKYFIEVNDLNDAQHILEEYVKEGDNLFNYNVPKNPILKFAFNAIRFFSKTDYQHVTKVASPLTAYSVEPPKAREVDIRHLFNDKTKEILLRRPKKKLSESMIKRMHNIWKEEISGKSYDYVQLLGIMFNKFARALHEKYNMELKRGLLWFFELNPKFMVCSHSCAYLDVKAFNFDPVEGIPDNVTDPGMLERSDKYSNILKIYRLDEGYLIKFYEI